MNELDDLSKIIQKIIHSVENWNIATTRDKRYTIYLRKTTFNVIDGMSYYIVINDNGFEGEDKE